MPSYTKLADGLDEVDVIIAGGNFVAICFTIPTLILINILQGGQPHVLWLAASPMPAQIFPSL